MAIPRHKARVSWNSTAIRVAIAIVLIALSISLPYGSGEAREIGTLAGVALDRSVTKDLASDYDMAGIGARWYYDYYPYGNGDAGIERANMIYRPAVGGVDSARKYAAAAIPGSVWFIGNEPDGAGQGNQTPQEYAAGYKAIYAAIKDVDSAARIYAGGISTVSPLRLAWLDAMLTAYGEPFPADGWHIHPYILPEACGWGLGYPVGIDPSVAVGRSCSYADRHADYSAFVQQIDMFTEWAVDRGLDRPIIVSEYGVLMAEGHGYDQRTINDYLFATTMYMHNNPRIERYAWFSVNFDPLPGQLFDRTTKQPTALGEAYKRFEAGR